MINLSEIVRRMGKDCPADVRLLTFILENTNSDGFFYGTYSNIALYLNLSESTVARVFRWMKDRKVIEKVNNGAWRVLLAQSGKVDIERYQHSEKDDEKYFVVENSMP